MDAREAVALAKQHVVEMSGDEHIRDVGLEDIRIEKHGPDRGRIVTIGFARGWPSDSPLMRTIAPRPRTYKIVNLDIDDGSPIGYSWSS